MASNTKGRHPCLSYGEVKRRLNSSSLYQPRRAWRRGSRLHERKLSRPQERRVRAFMCCVPVPKNQKRWLMQTLPRLFWHLFWRRVSSDVCLDGACRSVPCIEPGFSHNITRRLIAALSIAMPYFFINQSFIYTNFILASAPARESGFFYSIKTEPIKKIPHRQIMKSNRMK